MNSIEFETNSKNSSAPGSFCSSPVTLLEQHLESFLSCSDLKLQSILTWTLQNPQLVKQQLAKQIHSKKLSLGELMAYSNSSTLWSGFSDECKDTVLQMEIKINNLNSALSQIAFLIIIDKTSISGI